MTVKTETFQHPACTSHYGALVLFANAAELVVVGVVDETERHLVSRTRIVEHGIWQNLDLVLEAVRQAHPVDRLAYYHRGQYEAGLALVDRLNAIVPTTAMRAAKEDVEGADRPVLYAKFGQKLARVGIVAAGKLAQQTIRNVTLGPNDLAGVAIAAEEFERRHTKFTRKSKPARAIPAPSTPVEDDLRRRVAELEAKVAALVEILREKELAQAA